VSVETITLPDEIWKTCPVLQEKYLVSNLGRIFSNISNRLLSPATNNWGYKYIGYKNKENVWRKMYVHRAVASAFLGKSDKSVNHIDRNTVNNHVSNLEYVAHRENINHSNIGKITLKGVTKLRSGRFQSRIRLNGVQTTLGIFENEIDAHNKYIECLKTLGEEKYSSNNLSPAREE